MNSLVSRDPGPDTADLLAAARAAWTAGSRDDAVRRWRMAVTAAPEAVASYVNLARATGVDAALWYERTAATMAVDDPQVARNLGVLAQQRGSPQQALRCFRRALALDPGDVSTMAILAKLPRKVGAGHDPLRWCRRTVLMNPNVESGWFELSARLAKDKLYAEAAAVAGNVPIPHAAWSTPFLRMVANLYAKVAHSASLPVSSILVLREPLDPAVRQMRAVMLRRSGDIVGAVREARRAVLLEPDSFDGLGRLAAELARLESYADAVRMFRRCLCLAPARRPELLENMGGALVKVLEEDEAAVCLREALVRSPGRSAAYVNLSTLALQSADVVSGARLGRLAVTIDPTLADAQYNLGAILRFQGRIPEARASLERATALDDKPSYRYVRAMLELGDGDAEDGLRRYEVRWEVPRFSSARRAGPSPTLSQPLWRGERRPDASLAIWAEQGIGDELWFAGYLDWPIGRVGRIVVEVAESVVGLVRRSFPDLEVRAREAAGTDQAIAAADLQIPMGGIMLASEAASRPVPTGYFRVDPERVAALRARYTGGRTGKRVIGISWRSVKPLRGRSFEAPLDAWRPIFELDDAVFVSLQYGSTSADAEWVRERFGVELIVDSEIDAYRDLEGAATQMAATDRIVSIGNSTVSLAHGLGKPVDVILRSTQDDWRYTRHAETARWLPTARCFWQTDGRDWATPISRIAERWRRER